MFTIEKVWSTDRNGVITETHSEEVMNEDIENFIDEELNGDVFSYDYEYVEDDEITLDDVQLNHFLNLIAAEVYSEPYYEEEFINYD